MRPKWIKERRRKDEARTVYYVVDPPADVRERLSVGFINNIGTKAEAEAISLDLQRRLVEREPVRNIKAGSLADVFAKYRESRAFSELSTNSQVTYRWALKVVEAVELPIYGHIASLRTDKIGPEVADSLFRHLSAQYAYSSAMLVVRVLCKVSFVALRYGWIKVNPFSHMGIKEPRGRQICWSPEQVQAFFECSIREGLPAIGKLVYLCYDLCQRPGDMLKLTGANMRDGVVRFRQQKTGTEMEVVMSERLRLIIGEVDDSTHLIGKEYRKTSYLKHFHEVRDKAGLPPHLQIRDLRRTGATEMAESGATEEEIRAVTGHRSRNLLNTYVKPTVRLAEQGQKKRFGG